MSLTGLVMYTFTLLINRLIYFVHIYQDASICVASSFGTLSQLRGFVISRSYFPF